MDRRRILIIYGGGRVAPPPPPPPPLVSATGRTTIYSVSSVTGSVCILFPDRIYERAYLNIASHWSGNEYCPCGPPRTEISATFSTARCPPCTSSQASPGYPSRSSRTRAGGTWTLSVHCFPPSSTSARRRVWPQRGRRRG